MTHGKVQLEILLRPSGMQPPGNGVARRKVIVVPGTWGWDVNGWGSYGHTQMELIRAGYEPLLFPWSSVVGGVGFGSDDLRVWRANGLHLRDFARLHSKEPVDIISHSHGLQVVLCAAAVGLEIDRLIDCSGPYRRDLALIIGAARPRIRRWTHFRGDWWRDHMAGLGGWFDSWKPWTWFRNPRNHPNADENTHIKGGDHGYVREPSYLRKFIIPALEDDNA